MKKLLNRVGDYLDVFEDKVKRFIYNFITEEQEISKEEKAKNWLIKYAFEEKMKTKSYYRNQILYIILYRLLM